MMILLAFAMSFEAALLTAIGGCIACIVHLYTKVEKKSIKTEEQLLICHEDRNKLHKEMADIWKALYDDGKVNNLKQK